MGGVEASRGCPGGGVGGYGEGNCVGEAKVEVQAEKGGKSGNCGCKG